MNFTGGALASLAFAAALFAGACNSVAYDEAKRSEVPIEGGHDHTSQVASSPATMSGMDHSAHEGVASSTAQVSTSAPDGGSAAGTLAVDPFDAPSPLSVAEATKAANNVPDGDIRHIVPGQDHEHPRAPRPVTQDGGTQSRPKPPATTTSAPRPSTDGHARHRGASATKKPAATPRAVVYTCPMHPEVTSNKPGTCPKCGMALVKKK